MNKIIDSNNNQRFLKPKKHFKDIFLGIKFGIGFCLVLGFIGIIFASGWHYADEIFPGTFVGNYTFDGNVLINETSGGNGIKLIDEQSHAGLIIDGAESFNSYIDFKINGSKKSNIYYDSNNVEFKINTEIIKTSINSNGGNVGIGKSDPQSALDVGGTIRAEQLCDETGSNCNDISAGIIPTGAIMMFASACPSGWSEYSAMRGKFPRGEPTGNSGSLGTGGSDNAVIVSHTHSVNPPSTSSSSNGAHTHTDGSGYYPNGGSGVWGISWMANGGTKMTTSSAGAHAHTTDISSFTSGTSGVSGTGANIPTYQEVIYCIKN